MYLLTYLLTYLNRRLTAVWVLCITICQTLRSRRHVLHQNVTESRTAWLRVDADITTSWGEIKWKQSLTGTWRVTADLEPFSLKLMSPDCVRVYGHCDAIVACTDPDPQPVQLSTAKKSYAHNGHEKRYLVFMGRKVRYIWKEKPWLRLRFKITEFFCPGNVDDLLVDTQATMQLQNYPLLPCNSLSPAQQKFPPTFDFFLRLERHTYNLPA